MSCGGLVGLSNFQLRCRRWRGLGGVCAFAGLAARRRRPQNLIESSGSLPRWPRSEVELNKPAMPETRDRNHDAQDRQHDAKSNERLATFDMIDHPVEIHSEK